MYITITWISSVTLIVFDDFIEEQLNAVNLHGAE